MKEDAELLHHYAEEHSEEAFAELLRRHLDFVHSAALRQVGGDAHLAQDVAQSVFTDLACKSRSLAQRPTLAGWLYTSAHYAAAKVVRTERRRRAREREAQTMHELLTESQVSEVAQDWDRLRPVLDAAMRELNETDREAVLLRFFAGRSFTEVGKALRLTEDAARKRVERALDKLHGLLARRGLTSTAAAVAVALSQHAVMAAPAGVAAAIGGAVLQQAFAGAAATVAAQILTMSKIKVGLAFAVIVGLTATLFVQQQTLAVERSAVAGLTGRREQAAGAIAAANQRAADARAALDRLSGIAMAGIKPARATRLPSSPTVARARLDQDYASLFRRLHLRPQEMEKLKDLLAERDVSAWDVQRFTVATMGRWMSEWASQTEQWELTGMGTREIDGRIQALLGDARFAYYIQYERTRPWREPFTDLAEQLSYREPLGDEQIDQLTFWAAEANPDFHVDVTRGGPKVPAAVVDQAASMLTPFQLEKLRQLAAATDASRQMQLWGRSAERMDTAPDAVDRHLPLPTKEGR